MTHGKDSPWRRSGRSLLARALLLTLLVGAAISATPGRSTALGGSDATSSPARADAMSRPAFFSSVARVTAAQLGATWHSGCPVAPDLLRSVKMSYVGFDHRAHLGTIVVNQSVATAVIRVFKLLYQAGFPIKEMLPQSSYHGNDNSAAAADDTSGFNCRNAVAAGAPRWSVHAYGEAIDVNDVQNPYVDGKLVIPPAGARYENRSDVRAGMAVANGTLVDAFATIGWLWGGRWQTTPDYQHFSLTGG